MSKLYPALQREAEKIGFELPDIEQFGFGGKAKELSSDTTAGAAQDASGSTDSGVSGLFESAAAANEAQSPEPVEAVP